MQATGISPDEKRQALRDLLSSVTFRRAEQLRQFLEYVVEEDIAGRGAQIREWDIAVRALKRPESYSPETDSTVRTRAHSIRQRLSEYYRIEAPHAEIRVELPKGGYTPRFLRVSEGAVPEAAPPEARAEPTEVEVTPAPPVREGRSGWFWAAAGALIGIVCCVAAAVLLYMSGAIMVKSPTEPEIAEAWGPILDTSRTVKVIISSPHQLWVRDYRNHLPPVVDPEFSPPMPDDPGLIKGYADHHPLYPDSRLYLHPNNAGSLWGDAAGVQVATQFLAGRGIKTELVPEKSLKSAYVLRNDSYLAFGRTEYSPLMGGKVPSNGFDVQYLPDIRRHGIALRSNPASGPRFLPRPNPPAYSYGLITIIRDKADDGHTCQAMLFSGAVSNGAQAAIEFMTTPRHLQQLIGKLRDQGIQKWPKVMQVVVRNEMTDFYPIRTEYETHLVLEQ